MRIGIDLPSRIKDVKRFISVAWYAETLQNSNVYESSTRRDEVLAKTSTWSIKAVANLSPLKPCNL